MEHGACSSRRALLGDKPCPDGAQWRSADLHGKMAAQNLKIVFMRAIGAFFR